MNFIIIAAILVLFIWVYVLEIQVANNERWSKNIIESLNCISEIFVTKIKKITK